MTTLEKEELFEYLGHLEFELKKRTNESEKDSLQYLIHNQMINLIGSEKDFLRKFYSNGTKPILSISPNGLPSVASLRPDLEKMCELSSEDQSFIDISQKYIRGKENKDIQSNYVYVCKDDYLKELNNLEKEKLLSKTNFSINETEDGRFELSLREDLFLKGYDKYSKEFPVLTREGKIQYHVVWNRLIDNIEENFLVPNNALILNGKDLTRGEKFLGNIEKYYLFNKADYKSFKGRMPLLFLGNWVPNNYSEFLAAGTNSRVEVTKNILETLSNIFGKEVGLQKLGKSDLENVLAFANIPFKNAPKATPEIADFEEKGSLYKIPRKFDLIYNSDTKKIGEIIYNMPGTRWVSPAFLEGVRDNYPKLIFGDIYLNIPGSFILNESQFNQLNKELNKIRKDTQ
jgi:hypothetical protein